jgi:hypothetical protein
LTPAGGYFTHFHARPHCGELGLDIVSIHTF